MGEKQGLGEPQQMNKQSKLLKTILWALKMKPREYDPTPVKTGPKKHGMEGDSV